MATEDYYLDRDQLHQLTRDLETLIEHVFDVVNVLTRQTCYGKLPGHSPETPLPFHLGASDFLHELAYALPAICETIGYSTPFTHQRAIADCLNWLHTNPMKLAAYEDAEKCADDIARWARRIVHLVDRPRHPNFIGLCPECGKAVYTYCTQGETACECGTTIDIDALKAWYLQRINKEYFTRKELKNYLDQRGVPGRTRTCWLQKIAPIEYEGRKFWCMDHVQEKLRSWQRNH